MRACKFWWFERITSRRTNEHTPTSMTLKVYCTRKKTYLASLSYREISNAPEKIDRMLRALTAQKREPSISAVDFLGRDCYRELDQYHSYSTPCDDCVAHSWTTQREYTLGFWRRSAEVLQLARRYLHDDLYASPIRLMTFHGHDINHHPSIMSIHIEDQLLFIIIDISYTSIDRKQQRSVQVMYKYNLQTAHKSQKKLSDKNNHHVQKKKQRKTSNAISHLLCRNIPITP